MRSAGPGLRAGCCPEQRVEAPRLVFGGERREHDGHLGQRAGAEPCLVLQPVRVEIRDGGGGLEEKGIRGQKNPPLTLVLHSCLP